MKQLTAVLLILLLFGGCAGASAVMSARQENGKQSPEAEETSGEEQIVVYGKIFAVNGNEVVLRVGTPLERQMPTGDTAEAARPSGQQSAQGSEETAEGQRTRQGGTGAMPSGQNGQSAQGGEETAEGQRTRQGGTGATPSGQNGQSVQGGEETAEGQRTWQGGTGAMPSGQNGQSVQGASGAGMANRAGMAGVLISGVTLEYSGEEKTFLLPVNLSITMGEGERATTVRFTQLAEKNILKLTLDANGNILAAQVLQ